MVEFQPSLFPPDPLPVKQMLAPRIEALKQQDIFIGTSSWRYEGWLGQIYTPERYFTRGKFSKAKFHEECIQEYAELFPVVGGDFSFYGVQDARFWNNLFAKAPRDLKWNLKCWRLFSSPPIGPSCAAEYGNFRGTVSRRPDGNPARGGPTYTQVPIARPLGSRDIRQ